MTTIFTRRASGIFAPDPEPLLLPSRNFALHGEITATLLRAKSGTVIRRWTFPNLLVDVLLNALGTNAVGYPGVGLEPDATNYFAAGTGTTAPTVANTALEAEIAGGRAATTITHAFYVPGSPDYCRYTRQGTFSTSQANGTIGEFGWLSASSAGNMRARAIPKDGSGNPITIVKTSATTLVLDWSVYIRPLQTDVVLVRTVSGVSYTMTARAMGSSVATPAAYFFLSRGPHWGASLGARASVFNARTASSVTGTAVTGVATAYTNGSYQREMTFTTQAMAAFAFLTNCGGGPTDAFCAMQMQFVPSLPAGQPLKVTVSWALV